MNDSAVEEIIPALNGDDVIVLSWPNDRWAKCVPSLFRLRRDGTLVWTAEMPATDDATYVAVEWADGNLAGRRPCLPANLLHGTRG